MGPENKAILQPSTNDNRLGALYQLQRRICGCRDAQDVITKTTLWDATPCDLIHSKVSKKSAASIFKME
jgi:hypothetical protein